MTRHERLERARRAKQFVEEFQAYISEAEVQLVRDWQTCNDPEKREQLWHTMNALKSVLKVVADHSHDEELVKYHQQLIDSGQIEDDEA